MIAPTDAFIGALAKYNAQEEALDSQASTDAAWRQVINAFAALTQDIVNISEYTPDLLEAVSQAKAVELDVHQTYLVHLERECPHVFGFSAVRGMEILLGLGTLWGACGMLGALLAEGLKFQIPQRQSILKAGEWGTMAIGTFQAILRSGKSSSQALAAFPGQSLSEVYLPFTEKLKENVDGFTAYMEAYNRQSYSDYEQGDAAFNMMEFTMMGIRLGAVSMLEAWLKSRIITTIPRPSIN